MKMLNNDVKKITEIKQYLLDPPVSFKLYDYALIYLNDANSAAANAYHLLGARLGWKKQTKKMKDHSYRFNFYAGADNLLNEQYSLGNDINAAGGRYYNTAPRRNYYAGISISSL